VVDLRSDGFTLDDGTATGRVMLRGLALDRLVLIEPDDALNVVGRVEVTTDGAAVVVDDPGGIVQAGDPVAAGPVASAGAGESPKPSAQGEPASHQAGLGGGTWPVGMELAGIGTLLAVSAASLAVTMLRREQSRRRLAMRVAGRLATFAGPESAHLGGLPEATLGEPIADLRPGGSAERGPRSTDRA
jgi:hypothetical protein